MTPRALKALKGSIAKWHKIAYHGGEDHGVANCPLCQEYFDESNDDDICVGCPVYDHTKEHGCFATPYFDAWYPARKEATGEYWWADLPITAETPALRKAARAELQFLVTLLPIGEEVEIDGTIWYCVEE